MIKPPLLLGRNDNSHIHTGNIAFPIKYGVYGKISLKPIH
jgi:hypothetical protein